MLNKFYPKVNFAWNIDTEVERILHTAYKTATGFYTSKGFYVLNHKIKGDVSCVYLPEIDFEKCPKFWELIKQAKEQIPLKNASNKIRAFVKELISSTIESDEALLEKYKNDWSQIEEEFWNSIYHLFPSFENVISEIEVWITSFGTLSSYSHLMTETGNKMIIYLRDDFGIEQVAEAIITSLYLKQSRYSKSQWETSEGITDFLMTSSRLSSLFPKFVPTLENLNIDKIQIQESREYLSKIGTPSSLNLIIKDGSLFSNDINIEQEFSKAQSMIIKLLLSRNGYTVSYDEIADVIWKQENIDKYSIWAINKHIQRIKTKIAHLNIYDSSIVTIRGRGYMLVDLKKNEN